MKYCKYCGKKIKRDFCHCESNKLKHPELFVKVKKEKIKKESKKINFKLLFDKKVIIIASAVILLVIVGFGGYHSFRNNNKQSKYQNLATFENNDFYLRGLKENVKFSIRKKDITSTSQAEKIEYSYTITDSAGNSVNTELKEKDDYYVVVNKEKYKSGEEYTLKLNNYEFVDEELKDGNVLVFTIKVEEKKIIEQKKDLKKVKSNNIAVTSSNEIKTDKKYEVGDVILVDERQALKISKVKENGVYKTETPELSEVYDELDITYNGSFDFSKMEINDEFKDKLSYQVKQTEWYKNLLTKVSAAEMEKMTVRNESDGSLTLIIPITFDPFNGDDTFLKNHKFTFNAEMNILVDTYVDADLLGVKNMETSGHIKYDFSVSLSRKYDLTDTDKKPDVSEKIKSIMKNNNADAKKIDEYIGGSIIPTSILGLYGYINFYTILNLEVDVSLNLHVKDATKFVAGYKTTPILRIPQPYGRFEDMDGKDPVFDISLEGSILSKIGVDTRIGLSLVDVVKLDVGIQTGIYGEISAKISRTYQEDGPLSDIKYEGSAGLFIGGDIGVFDKELISISLGETKLSIFEYENKTNKNLTRLDFSDVKNLYSRIEEPAGYYYSDILTKKSITLEEFNKEYPEELLCLALKYISPTKKSVSKSEIDNGIKTLFGEIDYTIPKSGGCFPILTRKDGQESGWKYSNDTLTYSLTDYGVGESFSKKHYNKAMYFKEAYIDEENLIMYITFNVLGYIDNYRSSTNDDYYDIYNYTNIYTNTDFKDLVAAVNGTDRIKNYASKGDLVTFFLKKKGDYTVFLKSVVEESYE